MENQFDTLEKAQAEILRLNQELTARTNERDTLSQNNENLTKELGEVRTLNQNYFNQLSAQYSHQEEEKEEDEDQDPISCEEFAKTLKI